MNSTNRGFFVKTNYFYQKVRFVLYHISNVSKMSDLKFEGEVDGINERQLKFVVRVLEENGYDNGTVTVSSVGKADDNFIATIKRLTIEKDGQIFNVVAKVAPTTEDLREQMDTAQVFKTEHLVYTYILPKFTEIEKEACIPESERFRFAKCYGSLSEEPNEIILLEDLQTLDFVLLDRHQYFTDEKVKLVLKSLANLHSLSFVLKNREPDAYEDYKRKIDVDLALVAEDEGFQSIFKNMDDTFIPLLDNAKHKKMATGIANRLPEYIKKNYKIDKDSKYSVIQQGDCWNNNIMFKVKENKAVQCCLIDYQHSGNNSPVVDLHYMIFACTDYETRSKHYHEWIDYYHAQLDASLGNFGLKASSVYPRDQLDADLRRLAKLAFGNGIMLANILQVDTKQAGEIKENMKNDSTAMQDVFNYKSGQSNSESAIIFKDRVTGLVRSFVEFGYL